MAMTPCVEPDNLLKYIASNDDLIQLCGVDTEIAKKYQAIYTGKESKPVDFDPIISIASNPELLDSTFDFWSAKGGKKVSTKKFGSFDGTKYTKFFIKARSLFLEDNQNTEYKKDGFDCYAYLMAYEDDILTRYDLPEYEELSKLQKAALHFVEISNEEKQLDFLKYIATYDDLVSSSVSQMPSDANPQEWLIEAGKKHYEGVGRTEIHSGKRPVDDFFDPWKYIASYAMTKDIFWNAEDDTLDETNATIAYITAGSQTGLSRNMFVSDVYLANYPERVKDDIYVNEKVSDHKVAKLWLKNFPNEVKLDAFDPIGFAEEHGLEDTMNSFKEFVQKQITTYDSFLKKHKKIWFKVKNMMCGAGSLKSV